MNAKAATGVDARETVLDFINALNVEDFTTARACLDKNMQFSGVGRMKFKYYIRKVLCG